MKFVDDIIYVMALISVGLGSIAMVKNIIEYDWGNLVYVSVLFCFSLIIAVLWLYEIMEVVDDEFVG